MSELEHLLDEDATPLTISTEPPPYPPPSGTLILYDRAQTRNYKDDGYDWVKKRNSPKVREDHVKLRVGGRYRVAGCYVHSSTNDTFHRRTYHLLDPETGAALYPPNASSVSSVVALLSQTRAASNASVVSHDASVASAPSGGGRPRKPGGRSLVLVHYLDTDLAALHRAGSEDSSASEGTGGTGASSTVSRGSSVRSRSVSGSKRKKRSARALTGGRGSSTADVMAAVAGSAQAQAAIQVQAAQVAQFQQQQALTQMLRSSLRSTGQSVGAAGGGIGDGMGGGIGALAASGMTAQQIHQLATAQQQLQLQLQQQLPVMQGLVGSAGGSVGMGGVNQSAAAAATAAAQQAAILQAAATAGLAFPLPGINAQALGPMLGAQPFAAAPAAAALPSNVNSSTSVVSATPTPPLDGAAPAAVKAAAAADLRNEDQLHRLQCRLHSEGSPSLNDAGASAAAAAGRPMNRPASSAPMDDDTLDILWDMVMDEGNDSGGKTGTGRLKCGDSFNLETAADLAELFENDDKLGDMLEDAEGMLLADLASSDGTSDDFDAALADDAIAAVLAQDHTADEDASRFALGKPSRADEEQEMAAIAASAVSAFEQELRDARRAESAGSAGVASANATPEKVAPEQALVAPTPAVSNSYPSLQAQLSALHQTQVQLRVQQGEAERQIQSAQHQQLEAQLQQRGTLQASQLAQATDSLAGQMSGAMAPGRKAPYRGKSAAAASEGKVHVGEPLPDLVDFTPEVADLPIPADQPPKVMLSTSAPLPVVPSAETNIFHWHSLAAYVSASVNAANASVLDVHKLDLSLVKQINPYTFRSSVPVTAMTPGERRIIVVAVQLYAGTDPICEGVAAGVAAALQQAWTIAVGPSGSGGVPPAQVTKPTFTSSMELSSGQIKLLTQFSDDLFTFRGPV